MPLPLLAEHFARPPDWGVWILLYFFFAVLVADAVLVAGSFALGSSMDFTLCGLTVPFAWLKFQLFELIFAVHGV